MAEREASMDDHAFDDDLERAMRGDESPATSATVGGDLNAARFLARGLASLREAPPGARERTWESVQTRTAMRARRPFWRRMNDPGLGRGLKVLVAAVIIILVVRGATNLLANGRSASGVAVNMEESHIAFVSEQDRNADIYVMNADGSDLRRLTDDPAFDGDPAFSPDGQRIAFRSQRDGNNEIYVMNADGTGLVRLTFDPADDLGPVWSCDGQQIAFISNREGSLRIYAMKADGSAVTRLADVPAQDTQLTWECNG
jgi:Tol biopolymer transport system component